ncbi:unnamed protein product, partial [Rotaria magnacalcarata]
LINRPSRLYSLTIGHWDSSIIKRLPLYLTSNSVSRIDIQNYHYLKCDHYFNSEQWAAFLRSPWAKHSKVVQIIIDNRSSIDDLINVVVNIQVTKAIFQPGERGNCFPSR